MPRRFTPAAIATMFLGIVQPAALLWSLNDGVFDVTKHAEGVQFVHYVERLYTDATTKHAHHDEAETAAPEHKHPEHA